MGTCSSCRKKRAPLSLRIAPCGHAFCDKCLLRMARLALQDRALIPVRCCKKEFPIEYVADALDCKQDFEQYLRLFREREWQTSDLLSDEEYKNVVKDVGAKQCPGCGIGVLRDFGCIHMKCPNGHEFCYTCMKVWQTCQCPLIPEEELRAIIPDY